MSHDFGDFFKSHHVNKYMSHAKKQKNLLWVVKEFNQCLWKLYFIKEHICHYFISFLNIIHSSRVSWTFNHNTSEDVKNYFQYQLTVRLGYQSQPVFCVNRRQRSANLFYFIYLFQFQLRSIATQLKISFLKISVILQIFRVSQLQYCA